MILKPPQSFNVGPAVAVVKTLVMMAGEVEYENFIFENGDSLFPVSGHFMIMIFVVLVSIILMNLLVGLAVSDIQVSSNFCEKAVFLVTDWRKRK